MSLQQTDVVKARDVAKLAARTLRPLRTEQTIRTLAKEIADLVWENPALLFEMNAQTIDEQTLFNGVALRLAEKDWPDGWRMTYRVLWPDSRVHRQLLWPRFYKIARARLVGMLDAKSGTSEVMKERIFAAIQEDWNEKGN
jgi:hypothetical protein